MARYGYNGDDDCFMLTLLFGIKLILSILSHTLIENMLTFSCLVSNFCIRHKIIGVHLDFDISI